MATAYLTRAIQFSASHRYHRPEWSDEENERRFGSAARPDGHTHDYRCEVTVSGAIDPLSGMVMDLAELDGLLQEEIVERFHRRHINSAVPEFGPGRALPTTENLAAFIFDRLHQQLPEGVSLQRVRVMEDPSLWSDVHGSE